MNKSIRLITGSAAKPELFTKRLSFHRGSEGDKAGPCDALETISRQLDEVQRAYAILQAKGYGRPWMGLDEIVALVPSRSCTGDNLYILEP